MAILMRMLSLGSAFALMGCGTAPELPVSDQIRHEHRLDRSPILDVRGRELSSPHAKDPGRHRAIQKCGQFVSSQPPIDPAPSSPLTSEQIDEHVIHFDFGKSHLTEARGKKDECTSA
jgi:hypothetical protein